MKIRLIDVIDILIEKYEHPENVDEIIADPLCLNFHCTDCINHVFGGTVRPCVNRLKTYRLNWKNPDDYPNIRVFWIKVKQLLVINNGTPPEDIKAAVLAIAEQFKIDKDVIVRVKNKSKFTFIIEIK